MNYCFSRTRILIDWKCSWLWCTATRLTARRKRTVCLAKRGCLVSACKVTNKMTFAELVRGKKGSWNLFDNAPCQMCFTLSPFDNVKSKQGPDLEELTPAKKKKEKNNWALCVLLSPALTAADGREGPHLWGSPASLTFPLGWILIPFL